MRDSLVGFVTSPWNRISTKATDTFGLNPVPCPTEIDYTTKTKIESFGGWIEGSKFIFTKESLRRRVIHTGVLAREYMHIPLSKEGFENSVKEDFAFAYGALWLPFRMQKEWYKKWEEYCKFRGSPTTGFFSPCAAFQMFQSFSSSAYFDKLLTEYILMKKIGLVLSENDYVLHMLERIRRFSVQLNKTDFGLIRRLIADPGVKRSELAKETNISTHWVSRRLSSLQKHGVLQKYSDIFYPGIGMKQFILLINSEKEDSVFDYIKDLPFLYSANRVISGDYDLAAVVQIPDNSKNLTLVQSYLKILSDQDFTVQTHEIKAGFGNRCFDHYSTQRNSWELPWELFGPHLKKIFDEGLSKVMTPYMRPHKRAGFKMERLDLRIIEEYNIDHPLRNIREKLGIKYQNLVHRINRLKKEGIIHS